MSKKMTNAEMQAMIDALKAELTNVKAEKEKAIQAVQVVQEKADKAVEEMTGYSAERISYEKEKFDVSITCMYEFPTFFSQDTVQYRNEHDAFLIALGRKYIQTVLQAGKLVQVKAGRQARQAGTTRKTGMQAGNAKSVEEHALYDAVCRQAGKNNLTLVHADKYSSLKKEGKTVARLYFQRDNVKALVKEESAKKASITYTLMKFNLPASCILKTEDEIAQLFKVF